ncbi:hypothetical protein [Pontibacter ruber]|uniref:50S ribosomal protein L2 n=1 Tax=Pontibacter ruber TaxID=1343895 RepID=A0ABW5CU46_9BACT|nr:hypothetical protein [Pontibacter ruber]
MLNFNHTPRPGLKREARSVQILSGAGKTGKMGRDGNSYIGSKEMGTTVIAGKPATVTYPKRQDGQIKLVIGQASLD